MQEFRVSEQDDIAVLKGTRMPPSFMGHVTSCGGNCHGFNDAPPEHQYIVEVACRDRLGPPFIDLQEVPHGGDQRVVAEPEAASVPHAHVICHD